MLPVLDKCCSNNHYKEQKEWKQPRITFPGLPWENGFFSCGGEPQGTDCCNFCGTGKKSFLRVHMKMFAPCMSQRCALSWPSKAAFQVHQKFFAGNEHQTNQARCSVSPAALRVLQAHPPLGLTLSSFLFSIVAIFQVARISQCPSPGLGRELGAFQIE